MRLDITKRGDPAATVRAIADRYGRLSVVVNNAGRIIETPAVKTTVDDLRAVFETNLFEAAEMVWAALPPLRTSPRPRIVNVTSTTGSVTSTADGTDYGGDATKRLAYFTSKTALNMLTVLQYHRAFQEDPSLAHIKINAGTPGYTATDMNRNQGGRSVQQGARVIIELADLPDNGPSGGFFNVRGSVAW